MHLPLVNYGACNTRVTYITKFPQTTTTPNISLMLQQAMSNKEESQAVITPRQLDQLRNEVSSIKGLMIGK